MYTATYDHGGTEDPKMFMDCVTHLDAGWSVTKAHENRDSQRHRNTNMSTSK